MNLAKRIIEAKCLKASSHRGSSGASAADHPQTAWREFVGGQPPKRRISNIDYLIF